jgi:hypothetical protein
MPKSGQLAININIRHEYSFDNFVINRNEQVVSLLKNLVSDRN